MVTLASVVPLPGFTVSQGPPMGVEVEMVKLTLPEAFRLRAWVAGAEPPMV